MNYPADFKYTKNHEWVHPTDENTVLAGITHHAQEQLGDVVFVELPQVGDNLAKDDVFGVVESVKAVVDCYMPVSGEILAVNSELETAPERINSDPHGDGWMIKVKISDPKELDGLLTAEAYMQYLEDEQ